MRNIAYETILSNPKLPSMPAVALEVLELAAREDTDISDFERAIEKDQAIAVRILRSVNSSYYGLTSRCGSIRQAVALLGIQTVKGLVLGFSLECAVRGNDSDEVSFDFAGYWRRSLQVATAARMIARHVQARDPETAFISGLVQDAGMIAIWRAHGDRYLQIIDMANNNHENLAATESRILDVNHAEVTAEMVSRWRFPEELVRAIRMHHRDVDDLDGESPIDRILRLATIASAALENEAIGRVDAVSEFERLAFGWFDIKDEDARTLLGEITDDALRMSRALNIDVGEMPDSEQILARAAEMIAALPEAMQVVPEEVVMKTDPVTGLPDREELLADLEASFLTAHDGNSCLGGVDLTLLLVGTDEIRMLNERFGDAGGDEALMHVARCAQEILAPRPGAVGVYRFVGAEIAVILRGFDEAATMAVCDELRGTIARRPLRIKSNRDESELCTIRVTIGAAVHHPAGKDHGTGTPDAILRAAMCAVTTGRRHGGDQVFLHGSDAVDACRKGNAA